MKTNKNILYLFIIALFVLLAACSAPQKPAVSQEYLRYLADTSKQDYYTDDIQSSGLTHFINGEKLEQQGYYANAILEYLEALRYDTNAVIYYALGKNFRKLGKHTRAEEYFKLSLFTDSTFIPALSQLGELYLETYNKERALKTYEQLVRIKPTERNIRNLAFLYEFDDLKKSAELYEQLLSKQEDAFLLSKLAFIYKDLEDTAKYINYLERAYKLNPVNSDIIIELFDAYLANGEIEKTKKLIEETDYKMFQDELAEIYQHCLLALLDNNNQKLIPLNSELLDKIDARFYFDWRLQLFSGMLASKIKDTVRAEGFYKRAMTVADSIPDIPLQLADFYLSIAEYDKALAIVNEYALKHRENENFYLIGGFAYYMMDSLELSLQYFYKTISINPGNVEGHIQLGIVYDQLKNIDSSDYYYQKALELDPSNPLANNNYAYSLSLRKKDLDSALKMSEISLDAEPDNVAYLDTYGWILFQKGDYEDALKYLLKAIKLGGATSEFYLHLGEIYNAMGDKAKAIESWQKGLDIEPGNKEIKERLQKVK